MIPIYICDDDVQILEYLKKTINKTILINEYDMQVAFAASTPEQLLAVKATKDVRSIYFLDIDLKNKRYNGLTLAKELRKVDPRGYIIFVTTHGELMPETFRYRVEAINYIVKDDIDILKEQISETLCEINNLVTSEQKDYENYYTIKAVDTIYQIPIKEILYFETCAPHRLTLYSISSNIEFRGDLSQIEQELHENFLRVHQSFLVNKDVIKSVDRKNNILKLSDGSELPISRRRKKDLL